jgi:hypothetical protein
MAFAAMAIAFTAVSMNPSWWTMSLQVTESTNSSVPDGVEAQLQFSLSDLGYFNEWTNISFTKVSYSNSNATFLSEGISKLDAMRGINIALIASGSVLFLFGVAILINDDIKRFGFYVGCFALACFVLGITNICLLIDLPSNVEQAFGQLSPSQLYFECNGNWITWRGHNFSNVNSTVNCGGLWENDDYFLVDGGDTSATLNYKTFAGAGWWWIFGSTIAFMFCAGCCYMSTNFEGREIRDNSESEESGEQQMAKLEAQDKNEDSRPEAAEEDLLPPPPQYTA